MSHFFEDSLLEYFIGSALKIKIILSCSFLDFGQKHPSKSVERKRHRHETKGLMKDVNNLFLTGLPNFLFSVIHFCIMIPDST